MDPVARTMVIIALLLVLDALRFMKERTP